MPPLWAEGHEYMVAQCLGRWTEEAREKAKGQSHSVGHRRGLKPAPTSWPMVLATERRRREERRRGRPQHGHHHRMNGMDASWRKALAAGQSKQKRTTKSFV